MIIDILGRCDLGRVRTNNEDLMLIGRETVRDRTYEMLAELQAPNDRLVVAVADGMGGANAGEWASEYALGRLNHFLHHAPVDLDGEELSELLGIWASETHQEICTEGLRNTDRQGAGTTVVGMLFHASGVICFHAGDSRLYRYRAGHLVCLTTDHSMRQASGDNNVPSNLLLNSLGGGERSWLERAPLPGGLQDYDRFLLCSDGLHDLIDDQDISATLAAGRSTAVDALIQMANEAGGRDNISAVIVDVGRISP